MHHPWSRRLRSLCLAATVFSLAACGGGGDASSTTTSDPTVTAMTVGASGGTVVSPDGVQVVVPAGALSADTKVTIQRTSVGAPAQLPTDGETATAPASVYELTPHDVSFTQAVTIRLPADTSNGTPRVFVSDLSTGWYPHAVSAVGNGYVEIQRKGFSWVYILPGTGTTAADQELTAAVTYARLDILSPVNMKVGGAASSSSNLATALKDVKYDPGNIAIDTYLGVTATAQFQVAALACDQNILVLEIRLANGSWVALDQFTATSVSYPKPMLRYSVANYDVHFVPVLAGEFDLRARAVCALNGVAGPVEERIANRSWKMRMKVNPSYAVGGTVSGLPVVGSVKLAINGSTPQAVSANGSFTLSARQMPGVTYTVAVSDAPANYACTASNATGTLGSADVSNVAINCAFVPPSHQIGGIVVGLPSGASVTLLVNGANGEAIVNATGTASDIVDFLLAKALPEGTAYAVTVGSVSAANHACTVQNGSGTMGTADMTAGNGAVVNCYPLGPFTVSGDASGLGAGPYPSVVFSLTSPANVASTRTVALTGNGTFSLTGMAGGTSYSATVDTTGTAYSCFVVNGSGYADADKSNLGISCH